MTFESWKERAEDLEEEVYGLYLAFRDRRTPLTAKIVILFIVAYAISPVDPIPDFIPVLGYLDELVVLPVGVTIALKLIPDEIMHNCRERAGDEIDVGRQVDHSRHRASDLDRDWHACDPNLREQDIAGTRLS